MGLKRYTLLVAKRQTENGRGARRHGSDTGVTGEATRGGRARRRGRPGRGRGPADHPVEPHAPRGSSGQGVGREVKGARVGEDPSHNGGEESGSDGRRVEVAHTAAGDVVPVR